ncbi:hypothetical protein MA16_Dca004205 [Dendrobium catenatum]|uniref:Sister chromatid cohesion protein DCC1 n=1 Tax=Dendrobium catenatum TaxID=906689 RepID=A0A2I0W6T4_9ASPA|nr:hypothetical protein MA16_Dca004205 [Dendrobium catenatum]
MDLIQLICAIYVTSGCYYALAFIWEHSLTLVSMLERGGERGKRGGDGSPEKTRRLGRSGGSQPKPDTGFFDPHLLPLPIRTSTSSNGFIIVDHRDPFKSLVVESKHVLSSQVFLHLIIRVSIRGQPDEDAVLCTLSSTYAMKFVGTSNSVFLIPPGDSIPAMKTTSANDEMSTSVVASVITVAPGNIELIQAAPKLDKLQKLLSENPYNLEEDLSSSSVHSGGLHRWQDLVETIQASEEEIRAALKSLSAVEIDGYWRIVDDKTMHETLDMILRNSVLHDWKISALSEDCVLSTMEADGFPPRIVSHCLETHGSKVYCSNDNLWRLDEKRVCLRFALRVLSGGKMKLESFMDKWEHSIPPGMKADLKMLEGEVLYEKLGVEEWIRAFSISALPSDPANRFAALFRERQKWEWKDLEPYIR